jgi:ATP-dependent exoDNAse (exonuclease V) beta subunit
MPLLFWDRAKGAYLGRRTEDGDRDCKDPIEKQWRDEERFKELAESKRLFYVALTRARDRLILVFPPTGERPLEVEADEAFAKDFWRGWIEHGASAYRPAAVRALPGLPPSVVLAISRRVELSRLFFVAIAEQRFTAVTAALDVQSVLSAVTRRLPPEMPNPPSFRTLRTGLKRRWMRSPRHHLRQGNNPSRPQHCRRRER